MSACSNDAIGNAPVILQLDSNSEQYKDVMGQFESQWKHPTPIGGRHASVVKIWKIVSTRDAHGRFSRYQLSVERKRNLPGANTKRRWHGTIRSCRLGDADNENTLCNTFQCSLCSIIRTSFQLAHVGQRTNFGRFGAGIYTSATSSKANDYVAERGTSSYRALLLNDVVLGKTVKLTTGNPTLTEPPQDCDSVIGEPGGDLNYDESIVYKNEAIRPAFLVIFDAGV
ncbi:ADP-ribosylation [Amylostereum chailletii]|nr:ADP-ribosylation [Amylostereum chailletii]